MSTDIDRAQEAADFLAMADEAGGWADEMSTERERWYIERCHAQALVSATLALVAEQQATNALLGSLIPQRENR